MRVAVWAGWDWAGVTEERLGPVDAVVAADSGLRGATSSGRRVDVVIGDFDSVDPLLLASAAANGAEVIRHPPAKNATDLELAIDHAIEMGATDITVVGGAGGRLDHLLANLHLLTRPAYSGVAVSALCGPATVTVTRTRAELIGVPGELVTLLACAGDARGVSTEGLLYPLSDETLEVGSTRGVSNEMTGATAVVSVVGGLLLVVQPGERGSHLDSGLSL